jgi:integrase/recombinase XerD
MGFHQDGLQIYDGRGCRKYLDDRERERFLAATDKLCPAKRALCHVLAYSGARISEALQLGPHRLDSVHGTLCFRTLKRRRLAFRVVPIPDFLIALLQTLPVDANDRYWSLHRSTAWRVIHETMIEAKIAGPMATCKGLRHTFGIRGAICNVPAPTLQRLMGHASLATTAIYVDAVGLEEREFARRMW